VSSGQKLSRNRLKPTRLEANFSSINLGKIAKLQFFENYSALFEARNVLFVLRLPEIIGDSLLRRRSLTKYSYLFQLGGTLVQ
jgi:hypothetical protein